MTPKSNDPYKPVVQDEYPRLGAAPSPSRDGASDLWTEVHAEVQRQLASLEAEVRGKVTGVRVAAGRTHGLRFVLFSYRTFSIPDSDVDPVVAGVTFRPAGQDVTAEADVSGEQTGDSIASVPTKTVANAMDELLAVARESAGMLCQSAAAIATALADPARRGE